MHEMSMVEALLEVVSRELAPYPGARLRSVRVRVGQLRQVAPAAMEFAYHAAIRDTPLAGSRLELERVAAVARCVRCRSEFAVEENWFECPSCHAAGGELLAGDELLLTGIELEDASEIVGHDPRPPAENFPIK